MESTKVEILAVEQAVAASSPVLRELAELELVLVGGGMGETVL